MSIRPGTFHMCLVRLRRLALLGKRSHLLSKPAPDLFSNALCNTHGGHTPRLRAAYLASGRVPCLGKVLRHLGCFP